MKQIFLINVILVFISSCHQGEKGNLELNRLKLENDSLREIITSLKLKAFLDNTDFTIGLGEQYSTHILSVVEDGITIEEIFIDGQRIDIEKDTSYIKYDDFGPIFSFFPDTIGKYKITANVKVRTWSDRLIPLTWPLTVKE